MVIEFSNLLVINDLSKSMFKSCWTQTRLKEVGKCMNNDKVRTVLSIQLSWKYNNTRGYQYLKILRMPEGQRKYRWWLRFRKEEGTCEVWCK